MSEARWKQPGGDERDRGLYRKYAVTRWRDNSLVRDAFVLRPERDPAALSALMAYTLALPDCRLRTDLQRWVGGIRAAAPEQRAQLRKPDDWVNIPDSERGIIRCGKCAFGWGIEHADVAMPDSYTCPECGAIRQEDGIWVVPLKTEAAPEQPAPREGVMPSDAGPRAGSNPAAAPMNPPDIGGGAAPAQPLDRHALAHIAYEAMLRWLGRQPPPGSPYGETVAVRHDLDDMGGDAHGLWGSIGEAVADAVLARVARPAQTPPAPLRYCTSAAPVDDEPLSAEDRAALAEARQAIAEGDVGPLTEMRDEPPQPTPDAADVESLLAVFLDAAGDSPGEATSEQAARAGVLAVWRAIGGREAALQAFFDAHEAVEHGIADYDLHNAAVARLRATRDAVLALTPSAAAQAVSRLTDTLAEAHRIMADLLLSHSTGEGDPPDAEMEQRRIQAWDRLERIVTESRTDAVLAPFLPTRGGDRR